MRPKAAIAGTEPDMANIRVLVAEDDRAIRDLLVHHLERDGFTTVEAGDGIAALRLCREGVELALLDVGFTRCRRFRDRANGSSGRLDDAARDDNRACG